MNNDFLLKMVNDYKVLDAEQNNELAIRAQEGDPEAKTKLVCHNARSILKLANHYKTTNYSEEELFQDGVIGLLRAIETYDPSKSAFSTHSHSWIRAMMLKSFKTLDPIHYDSAFYDKRNRYDKLLHASGKNEFDDMELKDYNLTQDDIEMILKYSRESCSLESLNEISDMDGATRPPDNRIVDTSEAVDERLFRSELSETVNSMINLLLTYTEAEVIKAIYGIGRDSVNMAELARERGGTRQNIQQIKTNAEGKLRKNELLSSTFKEYC